MKRGDVGEGNTPRRALFPFLFPLRRARAEPTRRSRIVTVDAEEESRWHSLPSMKDRRPGARRAADTELTARRKRAEGRQLRQEVDGERSTGRH